MKKLGLSFILAALSTAFAFASGTVNAPNGNVTLDTGSPSAYTVNLRNNVTLNQSLATSDRPTFAGMDLNVTSSSPGAIFTFGGTLTGNNTQSFYSATTSVFNANGQASEMFVLSPTINVGSTTGGSYSSFIIGTPNLVSTGGSLGQQIQLWIQAPLTGGYALYSQGGENAFLGHTQLAGGATITGALNIGSTGTTIHGIHHGVANMNHGPVFVADASVTYATEIFVNYATTGPIEFVSGGIVHYSSPTVPFSGLYRSPGLGFWITSDNPNDINTVVYLMIEP